MTQGQVKEALEGTMKQNLLGKDWGGQKIQLQKPKHSEIRSALKPCFSSMRLNNLDNIQGISQGTRQVSNTRNIKGI